jgi:hypothetical protein
VGVVLGWDQKDGEFKTFGDFVTFLTEGLMQNNTVAKLQVQEYVQTSLSHIY